MGRISLFAALLVLLPAAMPARNGRAVPTYTEPDGTEAPLVRQVRHELLMLPAYGVFDNLSFHVDGSTVRLFGVATRPTLKDEAESAVKRIEGVRTVVNHIEVLPLSTVDDRIRLESYRAIYGQPGLDRYVYQAVPPIHIIVRNGCVTLEGRVATQADRALAEVRANSVPGVFRVVDNLGIDAR